MELEGLPAYVFESSGEQRLMPAAEILLAARAIEVLSGAGLIALASVKSRDAVRVPGMRSIAAGGGFLSGPWLAG